MKHYYSILLILLLPLIAVLSYASVDEPISTEIARVNLDEFLTADKDTIVAETAATDSVAIDTVPQRILLFGDSMVEGLGLRMAEYAAYNGHELTFITWVSSTTVAWNSDTLRHYLREANPTFVMINLGGNEQENRNAQAVERNIRSLLAIIGDIPYVWICTPAWDKKAPFNAVPERVCGKKRFFDSRRLTFQRIADHRHPTFGAAAIWMDSVATWLQSPEREHPIVMKRPPKGTEKKCVKYYIKPMPKQYGKRFVVTRTQYFGTKGTAKTTTLQSAPAPAVAPAPAAPKQDTNAPKKIVLPTTATEPPTAPEAVEEPVATPATPTPEVIPHAEPTTAEGE